DAVRPLDDGLEPLVVFFAEPQVFNGHLNTATVEDTHDSRLTVHRRQETDTQVKVLPLDRHLDAAVLGAALLGDVDAAHDLDARGHRGLEPAGRTVALDEHAVDAVAHPNAIGKRLDVNVAGPGLDGFLNDEVDQLDDRRIALVAPGEVRSRLRLGEV